MRVEYINPFLKATFDVLSEYGVEDVERGKIGFIDGKFESSGAAIDIGITGDLEGHVVFDMSLRMGAKLAELILMERLSPLQQDLVKSGMSEFVNIIVGRSVGELAKIGFRCKVTPPVLYIGEGINIVKHNVQALVVPVHLSFGTFIIYVALKEKRL